MRKIAAATLAVPILVVVYALALPRRAARALVGRRALPFGVMVALVAAVGIALGSQTARPAPIQARGPTVASPLPAAAFHSEVRAGTSPNAVVTMTFPAPMSATSVAAAIEVDPAGDVQLSWSADATVLSISARGGWETGRYHTVTVPAGTLEASGRPIPEPVRASFLTRPSTIGTIAPSDASLAPTFRVTFDRPVLAWTVDLQLSPAVSGYIRPVVSAPAGAPAFEFVPSRALAPGTTYAVSLAPGALDDDGVAAVAAPLVVTTPPAPTVVRFRPADASKAVDPKSALSVRFTVPMDEASTAAAWSATQGGTAVAGTVSWSENDTVLVFTPKATLAYAQSVTMTVGTGATSKAGVALGAAASASFTTAAKPVAKPVPVTTGGTTSVGSGTWAAVEAYYLSLMNCTRTGGTVSTSGSCSGAGTRAVAPLWQDMGISANVSRPYAKKLVIDNVCSHFYGSTPAQRLSAAGYTSYIWAENIGCGGGDPYAAMLADHLFFQNERNTSPPGGHYVNLMDTKYDRCGIGVWAYAGRVRLVVDFYHPL